MNISVVRTRRRLVVGSTVVTLIAGAAIVVAAPAGAATTNCSGAPCTATFDFTGDLETFTVPSGVTSLALSVSGAQGGTSRFGVAGGMGATVIGGLAVTPGQTLDVLVGQAGSGGGGTTFGGGGSAGAAGLGSYFGSGGGGSFLFDTSGELLAAAGGGGGGGLATNFSNPPLAEVQLGGAGAGAAGTGGSGVAGAYAGIYGGDSEVPPTGGTPSGGGLGGAQIYGNGSAGSGPAANFQPGSGGNSSTLQPYYEGGGGGGGYYGGGGGGYAESGAGGSGFAGPLTNVQSTDGTHAGNGQVTISWNRLPSAVGLVAFPPAGSTVGDWVFLSATVTGATGTPTGTVEFDANGTPISGCTRIDGADGYGSVRDHCATGRDGHALRVLLR